MPTDPVEAMASYGALRTRVTDLLRDVDDESASVTPVPACPGWTVTNVVAHIHGVCVDILEGNIADAGTTPWADAQAARWSDLGLTAILERWAEAGPQVEALGAAFPPRAAVQFVFDATTHEHDVRGALGSPGARDTASLATALDFLALALDGTIRERSLPSLEVRASDGWATTAGEVPAQVHLTTTSFEVLRGFGGRRSEAQLRALDWTADPEPYLVMFAESPLTPPEADLIE